MHSEWNAEDDLTHLFQIWIETRQRNLKPRWDQAQFPKGDRANRLVPLASGEEAVRSDAPSTLLINHDATLSAPPLAQGVRPPTPLKQTRLAYVLVAEAKAPGDAPKKQ